MVSYFAYWKSRISSGGKVPNLGAWFGAYLTAFHSNSGELHASFQDSQYVFQDAFQII